jgi:pimeloyl-ACP methyl ester carboxylesterase
MLCFPRALCIAGLALLFAARAAAAAGPFAPPAAPAASFDAGTLHIDKYGTGKQPLVLIPGLASGPWTWYGTIARFAPDYSVYVVSLPGFDGRAATDKKPLFAQFATDFWAMLAANKMERPVVVGHSLGGTLAIALAEEHPERLSGIVALDGLPVFPTLASATAKQREAAAADVAHRFASLSPDKELESEKRFMSTIGTNKPEVVEAAAKLAARSDPRAIAAWLQEDFANDLRPNLAKINIPFLEIIPYNAPDAKPPMAYTKEQTLAFYRSLVAGAPKVTVVAIEPSRHFVMLDQPEEFYKSLRQFLSSIHR